MFVSKHEPLLAVPVSEGTVFTVQAAPAVERRVVIENLDANNTMTWRFQSSDDSSVWTDVATDASLAPGLRVSNTLQGSTFYRLRASGSLNIAAKVDAEVAIVADTFSFVGS
jgi:hypothetical protein